MALTGPEIALYSVIVKSVTDILTVSMQQRITLKSLDEALANEEVRAKILEMERESLMNPDIPARRG